MTGLDKSVSVWKKKKKASIRNIWFCSIVNSFFFFFLDNKADKPVKYRAHQAVNHHEAIHRNKKNVSSKEEKVRKKLSTMKETDKKKVFSIYKACIIFLWQNCHHLSSLLAPHYSRRLGAAIFCKQWHKWYVRLFFLLLYTFLFLLKILHSHT